MKVSRTKTKEPVTDGVVAGSQIEVTIAQINTKRQWPFAVRRVLSMLADTNKVGATIVTFNEISSEQVAAIRALPGWSVHYEVNDQLGPHRSSGNAVAYRDDIWDLERGWGMNVVIDYRRGRRKDPRMGPWAKKVVKFACVRLRHKRITKFKKVVQAFHNPTRFNSNESSREKCVDKSSKFATGRIMRKIAVTLGGDSNNILPNAPGLKLTERDGPDVLKSNGRKVRSGVLPFKLRLKSDHNGIWATIRFKL